MSRKQRRQIIGIVGLGVVGDAVDQYFTQRDVEVRRYDPLRRRGSREEINQADIVFVCVPTPHLHDVGFDGSAVESTLGLLDGAKTVVIKSTVLPGTTEDYQRRFPQHSFLFNPEFLREATARADFVAPDRQIVGYTAQSRHLSEEVLAILPPAPFSRTMPAREAELTKYMANGFLALKVMFANEMFDLTRALDAEYDIVSEGVGADPRIGASHLDVLHGGYRGYGGKCLPKDTKALLALADQLGISLQLLRTADRMNAALLPREEQFEALGSLRDAGGEPSGTQELDRRAA